MYDSSDDHSKLILCIFSFVGNVITRPKETPQPEKKKKLQKRTPVRPKKSSPSSTQDSIAPLPMPSQKSKEEDASPNILQLQQGMFFTNF